MTDFLGRHAVAVDVRRHPLAVGQEIRHHGGVRRHGFALGLEHRHDHGRGGVHGDDDIGRLRLQEPGQSPRAEPCHSHSSPRIAGHPVAQLVGQAPQERRATQRAVIEPAASVLEGRVHEVAEVVDDDGVQSLALQGGGERARGRVVTGSIARREDESATHRLIPS
jgi:hypothetical protein